MDLRSTIVPYIAHASIQTSLLLSALGLHTVLLPLLCSPNCELASGGDFVQSLRGTGSALIFFAVPPNYEIWRGWPLAGLSLGTK